MRRLRTIICALAALGVIPSVAQAQEDCVDYCNEPTDRYCSLDSCFDGILRTTCKAYATHYGSNPYTCEEPPYGGDNIFYPGDGIPWDPPNGAFVDQCSGNCGAGCSDRMNPCMGDAHNQYWRLTYYSDPVYGVVEGGTCIDQDLYRISWMAHTASGRWTYYGYRTEACEQHDAVCPELVGIGCVWFFGCWGGHPDTWSYDVSLFHPEYEISFEYVGWRHWCRDGMFWRGSAE